MSAARPAEAPRRAAIRAPAAAAKAILQREPQTFEPGDSGGVFHGVVPGASASLLRGEAFHCSSASGNRVPEAKPKVIPRIAKLRCQQDQRPRPPRDAANHPRRRSGRETDASRARADEAARRFEEERSARRVLTNDRSDHTTTIAQTR